MEKQDNTATLRISSTGSFRDLLKEVEDFDYRVSTLKYIEELTPAILKQLLKRLNHINDRVSRR